MDGSGWVDTINPLRFVMVCASFTCFFWFALRHKGKTQLTQKVPKVGMRNKSFKNNTCGIILHNHQNGREYKGFVWHLSSWIYHLNSDTNPLCSQPFWGFIQCDTTRILKRLTLILSLGNLWTTIWNLWSIPSTATAWCVYTLLTDITK